MSNQTSILTDRFLLRNIEEKDVTERYLNWFHDLQTRKYIAAASNTKSLLDIRRYVKERVNRDDVLFLGIFEKNSLLHIGNIKYEPVNSELGYAIMGIMIGDPEYRGKGVGTEVLKASADWLKLHCNIKQIVLGVSEDNPGAIRSYEKAGFKLADTPYIQKTLKGTITMAWDL
jgi:[ribosomal protein S5]-alanine N-acetyltransferase